MNIEHIRQQYRKTRQQLPPHQQQQHACLLTNQLQRIIDQNKDPLRIAAYSAIQGEISLDHWISNSSGQTIFLPRLYEVSQPMLLFAEINAATHWTKNRFGIKEPDTDWRDCLPADRLDIILLPLVAFDRSGYRLGMGGGYYDRSLAFRKTTDRSAKPRLIGVAHSCQEYTKLPHQPWDIPLDHIITEREVITPDRDLM